MRKPTLADWAGGGAFADGTPITLQLDGQVARSHQELERQRRERDAARAEHDRLRVARKRERQARRRARR